MIEDSEIVDVAQSEEQSKRFESSMYIINAYPASQIPKDYIPLVLSRWMRSLRFGNPLFKQIDSDAFYKDYDKFLKNLLAKPGTEIRFAIIPEDINGPEVILGFAVTREDVLDYIHVQKDFRRKGIAKALVANPINVITHITMTGALICEKRLKDRSLKFNPFA